MRRRWARELHDEPLQGLAVPRLALTTARKAAAGGAAEALDLVIEPVDDDIAILRALITDLRPAALDELGLESVVAALADRARRSGIDDGSAVRVAVSDHGRDFDPDQPTR